ncbi:MAG: MgtC/SapB family protein [Oscillospiraceae bacterium]|nr:MgtC/SapB family protein [Oscillospiraceae bacterium]
MFQNLCFFGHCLHTLSPVSIFVRLTLAILLGGIIGLERRFKGRPAGMRTYMLVCLGSALVMITNEYMTGIFSASDPARMGAQVISGIGFLGAGTIIITRDRQVQGLTTAASLWASACMGLAIGVGFYAGAFIGMVFILFITLGMHKVDRRLLSKSRTVDLYVELTEPSGIYQLLDYIREHGHKVTYMEIIRPKHESQSQAAILLSLLMPARRVHYELLAELNEISYVGFAEEV